MLRSTFSGLPEDQEDVIFVVEVDGCDLIKKREKSLS